MIEKPPFPGEAASTIAWLRTRPTITELAERFPEDWQFVQGELAQAVEQRNFAQLHRLLRPENGSPGLFRRNHVSAQQCTDAICQRMASLAIEHYALTVAIGGDKERRRINWLNGFLAQRLLFAHGLARRPVPLWQFRTVWPMIWQRRRLMPLVGRKGIYCFYSREFVDALAQLVGSRHCHEIAAGDGTLARFLRDAGVDISASDNHGWSDRIDYPADVSRIDASVAVHSYRPQVVICSWPPAGNTFEREVFAQPAVQLYVAILSVHEFAAGNWAAYREQRGFDYAVSETLSSMLLPPELGCQVVLFTRKAPSVA